MKEEEKEGMFVYDLLHLLQDDNMGTYQLLIANWSKLSCMHVRHGKSNLRWGVDL